MDTIDNETLRAMVLAHRPNWGPEISFQPIPTGKFNDSWFVTGESEDLVLRVAPPADSVFCFYERDMMRQEPGIHSLLLDRTSVPVAPILAFDDSHGLIDRDYLLMERLPGRPLTEAGRVDGPRVLQQVGEYLRQAHEITANRYGYLGEHRPMEPADSWAEAFHTMWNRLIDDVEEVGHYDDEEASELRGALDANIELFERDGPPRLLHMDVWAQNILVGADGTVTGLVDWDRALWGDPEIEFAVLDYCGISEPPFWDGYGRRRDDSEPARLRRVFYLLYEVQKYIVIRQGRSHDPEGARGYKRQVLDVAREQLGCAV
jgi:aminoglycoside phosphotransferase (APT) family kinase protein